MGFRAVCGHAFGFDKSEAGEGLYFSQELGRIDFAAFAPTTRWGPLRAVRTFLIFKAWTHPGPLLHHM